MKIHFLMAILLVVSASNMQTSSATPAPKVAKEQAKTITLASAEVLGERLYKARLSPLVERTRIDEKLGGHELQLAAVGILLENAIHTYSERVKFSAWEMALIKNELIETVLQDHPAELKILKAELAAARK